MVSGDGADKDLVRQFGGHLTHLVDGRYPADDAGVLNYHLKTSADQNRSWIVNGQDVLLLAQLLLEGRYPVETNRGRGRQRCAGAPACPHPSGGSPGRAGPYGRGPGNGPMGGGRTDGAVLPGMRTVIWPSGNQPDPAARRRPGAFPGPVQPRSERAQPHTHLPFGRKPETTGLRLQPQR